MSIKPADTDMLDLAFGRIDGLLPAMKDIPEEFFHARGVWCKWQEDWFYSGLKRYPIPKDGIDIKRAMAHLKAIQSSWSPQHEHKQAGVAYLASLWFTSPDGDFIKPKQPA
jgi:hypothetical protein